MSGQFHSSFSFSLSPSPFSRYTFRLAALACKPCESPGLFCLAAAVSPTSGTEYGTQQVLNVFLIEQISKTQAYSEVIKSTGSGVTLPLCEYWLNSYYGILH